jgi:tRNA dimethylallyltransferase
VSEAPAGFDTIAVVCGPTAAGKSAIAMALSERHGLAIVSADSRQIYRGFDIGTAKPAAAERALVPHFGIDVVEPTERYSAASWAGDALEWTRQAEQTGRRPLVVGGTGFYLRALFAPLFVEPPMAPGARAELEPVLGALDLPTLRRWCEALDPARAHLGRTQLLRSIEIALLTGRSLSGWHVHSPRAAHLRARYLVVDPGPALHARIERRVRDMLATGWADEVRSLIDRVPATAPAWQSSGYGAMRAFVSGDVSERAAVQQIVIETRQYAKRQRTWFRHQLGDAAVTLVNPDDPDATAIVDAWWSGELT